MSPSSVQDMIRDVDEAAAEADLRAKPSGVVTRSRAACVHVPCVHVP